MTKSTAPVAISSDLTTAERQLHGLSVVTSALNSALDLDSVLEQAIASMLEVTGLTCGVMYFADHLQRELVGRNAVGFRNGLVPGIDRHSLDDRQSLAGRAFHSQAPLVFDVRDPLFGYASVTEQEVVCIVPENLRAAMAMQVRSPKQVFGAFVLASQYDRRPFDATELQFIEMVASQIGVAIERAQLQDTLSDDLKRIAVLDERTRIAREIHDGLTQCFYAIEVQLKAAEMALDGGEDARSFLDTARASARHGVGEARRSIRGLRAAQGDGENLIASVRSQAALFARRTGIKCDVAVTARQTEFDPFVQSAIYSAVQELLHNVEKHARADHVNVAVTCDDRHLEILVQDDGVGFERRARGGNGSFGLGGVQERMAAVGGRLILQSSEGEGTTARLVIHRTAS